MNAENREIMEDTLKDIKFSGMSWKANEGFYYSSYDKPEGSQLSAKTDQHKVYYHELGTPQSDDQLIFGGTPEQKHRYIGAEVTEDDHYLIINPRTSTSGNKLMIKDLTKPDSGFTTILDSTDTDSYVIDNVGSKLFIATNRNAPNMKIVTVDAANPTPENWVDFIPETKNVLSPSTGGGSIFAEYMVDAVSQVKQFDYDGNLIREVALPGVGSVGGFSAKRRIKNSIIRSPITSLPATFTNMILPLENRSCSETGDQFQPRKLREQADFYTSKDGTKIPMIITHKKA